MEKAQSMVSSIGSDTISSIAKAGPEAKVFVFLLIVTYIYILAVPKGLCPAFVAAVEEPYIQLSQCYTVP